VEYLLLEFADGMFRSLTPCNHVAQISNLRKHKRDFLLYFWAWATTLYLRPHCWRMQQLEQRPPLLALPRTSGNPFPDPEYILGSVHHICNLEHRAEHSLGPGPRVGKGHLVSSAWQLYLPPLVLTFMLSQPHCPPRFSNTVAFL
jgi:hypothetical protein